MKKKLKTWAEKEIESIHEMNKGPKMKKRLKRHLKQFEEQGWTDADTWSLDHSFAKYIAPRLKKFRELNNGYPGNLTEEKWNKILDEMIEGFEFAADENKYWDVDNDENFKKLEKALDHFKTYFRALWW